MSGTHNDDTTGPEAGLDFTRSAAWSRLASIEPEKDVADAAMQARLAARMFGKQADTVPSIGRFQIVSRIGTGGMGSVYEAHDPELERSVAIKLLHSDLASDSRVRLRREAQALARVNHNNVVRVYEVGTHESRLFIAMELIKGTPLSKWQLSRPWPEVVAAYRQAGEGLRAAHREGLIHRDFKPANAIMGIDGVVRVLDFGLAREAAQTEPFVHDETAPIRTIPSNHSPSLLEARITVTGAAMGTPRYMAPEQMLGQELGPEADQFGFCVALYEALYGIAPFAGDTLRELCRSMLEEKLRPPPPRNGVPRRIARALERGMQLDPANRHPSMAALLGALRARSRAARLSGLGAGATVLSLVSATAWPALRGREAPSPDDNATCQRGLSRASRLWTPEQRDELEARFAAANSGSPDGFAVFDRALGLWVSEWRAAYAQACRAIETTQHASFGPLACLDQQLDAARATVAFLDDSNPQVLRRARFLAEEFPDIAGCAETSARLDRDAEAEVLPARLALAGARYADAKRLAEQIAERAQADGDSRVEGEARLAVADWALWSSDAELAHEASKRALELGLSGGYPQLTVDAWERMAWVEHDLDSRPSEALAHLEAARNLLPQLAAPGPRLGRLLMLQARILTSLERMDEAKALLVEARQVLERTEPPSSPSFNTLEGIIASLAILEGRYEEAVRQYEDLRQSALTRTGQTSIEVANLNKNLAEALFLSGDHERARALASEALQTYTASPHTYARRRISTLRVLAEIERRQDEPEAALDWVTQALGIAREHRPASLQHFKLLLSRADLARTMAQWTEGLHALDSARAIQIGLGRSAPKKVGLEPLHVLFAFRAGEAERAAELAGAYHDALLEQAPITRAVLQLLDQNPGELDAFLAATDINPAAYMQP